MFSDIKKEYWTNDVVIYEKKEWNDIFICRVYGSNKSGNMLRTWTETDSYTMPACYVRPLYRQYLKVSK